MERKRASEASVERYRNNAAMPFFLKTKTVTSLSKAAMRARTQGENAKPHTLRSLSDTLPTSPIPLITHLFSAAALSSSPGQFEFITLNVNIGATAARVRQVQLVE